MIATIHLKFNTAIKYDRKRYISWWNESFQNNIRVTAQGMSYTFYSDKYDWCRINWFELTSCTQNQNYNSPLYCMQPFIRPGYLKISQILLEPHQWYQSLQHYTAKPASARYFRIPRTPDCLFPPISWYKKCSHVIQYRGLNWLPNFVLYLFINCALL